MATASTQSESQASSLLKPLSFPEVERDLRCYYDPNYDLPIPCMFCDCSFNGNNATAADDTTAVNDNGVNETSEFGQKCRDLFLKHLLTDHNLVIHRMCDITSYRCYSLYWKVRFKEVDASTLLPIIKTNPDTPSDHSQYFRLLSDACPEDKQLRHFLQRKRLEALLDVQHTERRDTNFNQTCLFCSEQFQGERSLIFKHMLKSHNFSIGQPDNIVFVSEFLETLRAHLTRLQCLYCDRIFRDMSTLKDHMRKKQHRKINPNNNVYDKYYLINYLEIGKTWQEILNEDDRDITGNVNDDEAQESEDEVTVTNEGSPLVCLFCTTSALTRDSIILHMKQSHGFDFLTITSSLRDDFYAQVKVINYIRRKMYEKVCLYCQVTYTELAKLVDHMTVTCHFRLPQRSLWDQPQYLFPTYENDGLLCILEDDDLDN